jgi:hypothetical protein
MGEGKTSVAVARIQSKIIFFLGRGPDKKAFERAECLFTFLLALKVGQAHVDSGYSGTVLLQS